MQFLPLPSPQRAVAVVAAFAALGLAPAAAQETPTPVDAVEVEHLERAEIVDPLPGIVAARRESRLGFETGGRLADIRVDVGDRVEGGEVLAVLDVRHLDARVAAAEAAVDEARAAEKLARLTRDRQLELQAKGHVSAQRLDEAQANVEAAAARAAAAEAGLEQLRVSRDLAELRAPFSGVVTARRLDEGAVAGPGEPVLDLVENGALEVRAGLPLDQARRAEIGRVYTFAASDGEAAVTLRALTGVVDRSAQTVSAVFDVEAGAVAAGEVGRLMMTAEIPQEGFWVPLTALSEGRRGLWTVMAMTRAEEETDFRLETRVVDVLYTEAERAFVRGALEDGELIVGSGRDRVVPGQLARPVGKAGFASLAQADAD